MSATPPSTSASPAPSNSKYALSAVEKQRNQLERLLKDPTKAAYVPPPPKEKIIRPPREMMKNVQGSSAGAGSGEFHVYKASRRREYERIKMMEDEVQKEATNAEFERKRKEAEAAAEAKTAKNRAKRQKKKGRAKNKDSARNGGDNLAKGDESDDEKVEVPFKKRRLVNGESLTFRRPGEESDNGESDTPGAEVASTMPMGTTTSGKASEPLPVAELPNVIIHED